MKLEQIILEYTFPEIKYQRVSKLPDQYHHGADSLQQGGIAYQKGYNPRVMRSKGVEHLGTGQFGSVYGHKDRPHDVRKISRSLNVQRLDGFFYFLKALSETPEENTNPYFPRIRSITVYTSPNENAVYTVQMERLFPVSSLSQQHVEYLWQRVLGEKDVVEEENNTNALIAEIREIVLTGATRSLVNKADPDFLRAVRFIREVAGEYNVGIDLHKGNFRVRHSPYGPQLVFADPLGFKMTEPVIKDWA